jgi:SNF2 family DNA or RNA helicase
MAMNKPPMVPRPEQESATLEVLAHKAHLCRGETGAGKTLIGVEAVLRSKAKITLVVCPVNTFSSWTKTFQRQSGYTVTPRVIDSKTKAGKLAFEALVLREPGVYLVGWEKFRMYDWANMPLDFTIIDECHRQQNRRAGTHEAIMTTKHSEYKLALSATPWGNHIQGAWAAIRWLWYGRDDIVGKNDSFWNWVTMHMTTSLDKYSGKKVEAERTPGTVWASLPSKSYFPSPYQDEPIIHEVVVPLKPAQRKLYDRFEQEAIVWLEEHPLVADLPAVMRVRLREICLAVPSIRFEWQRVPDKELDDEKFNWDRWQMEERENGWYAYKEVVYFEEDAYSTKADAMLDKISDLHAGGPVPILIFTHSAKFATMLTMQLQAKGYSALRFIGGMPTEEREWKKENFGIEYDIMVSSIATVGEGTDGLQDVCNIEFWVSLEDNRLLNTQAKGRLSRPGQKKTVQRFMFLAENTVEVRQAGKLQADQEQLDASFAPLEEMEAA